MHDFGCALLKKSSWAVDSNPTVITVALTVSALAFSAQPLLGKFLLRFCRPTQHFIVLIGLNGRCSSEGGKLLFWRWQRISFFTSSLLFKLKTCYCYPKKQNKTFTFENKCFKY